MAYTPPAGDAVDFSWVGQPAYTAPAGDDVDFAFPAALVAGRIALPSPLGAPALLGYFGVIVAGQIAIPSPLAAAAARLRQVYLVRISLPGPLAAPALAATVIRYRLAGEVRSAGVLINRRVRAYRRSDGALIAQADTIAGRFDLHAGFAPDEYLLVPVDLGAEAVDYAPPAANRVVSVLVQD